MTTRERMEYKLQKRLEWAESRKEKSDREWDRGDLREEKSGIPFGQPVLVGHHSERRHRRAIERADRAMCRAVEHGKMAEHHENKAQGIETMLESTIFSDDKNAVEALEAKIAGLEKEREQNNQVNKIIRGNPKYKVTLEKIAALTALGLSEITANKLFEPDCCGRIGIPAYVNQNIAGRIKAARDRLVMVKRRRELAQAAQESENGVLIKRNCYGDYFITFAEKPDYEIIKDLKAAGYRWVSGSWVGKPDNLPVCVKELVRADKLNEIAGGNRLRAEG